MSAPADVRGDFSAYARRLWGWPVAILVGFPIAGLVADLIVDGVDSAGAALLGGAIAGAICGAAQWFALRDASGSARARARRGGGSGSR